MNLILKNGLLQRAVNCEISVQRYGWQNDKKISLYL